MLGEINKKFFPPNNPWGKKWPFYCPFLPDTFLAAALQGTGLGRERERTMSLALFHFQTPPAAKRLLAQPPNTARTVGVGSKREKCSLFSACSSPTQRWVPWHFLVCLSRNKCSTCYHCTTPGIPIQAKKKKRAVLAPKLVTVPSHLHASPPTTHKYNIATAATDHLPPHFSRLPTIWPDYCG